METVQRPSKKQRKRVAPSESSSGSSTASSTQNYRALSPCYHAFLKPQNYGAVRTEESIRKYLYDVETSVGTVANVQTIPIIVKCFEEVLENALDQAVKNKKERGKKKTTQVDISIDEVDATFRVRNDGRSIPIEKTDQSGYEGMYVPQMIFGVMNAGSNFFQEDLEGIGQNGMGVKLANIFSRTFSITCVSNKQRYTQEWRWDEMDTYVPLNRRVMDPTIEKTKESPFTEVFCALRKDAFEQDHWWGEQQITKKVCDEIPKGCFEAMRQRVYHAKMLMPDLKIVLDGEEVPSIDPKAYIASLVEHDVIVDARTPCAHLIVGEKKNVLDHQSFVNGTHTSRGGRHVRDIRYCIRDAIESSYKKINEFTAMTIAKRLFLYVNATVSNPIFRSQEKVEFTGCNTNLANLATKATIRTIAKHPTVERMVKETEEDEKTKERRRVNRRNKKRSSVDMMIELPKLTDAVHLGKGSMLIVCEGDSAVNFIRSLMDYLPDDKKKRIGYLPLKGKPLNCTEASIAQIGKSMRHLILALGLQFDKKTSKELAKAMRYESVVICTDQDVDGFHIKGLLATFFAYDKVWAKHLLEGGFLKVLKTPVAKHVRRNGTVVPFYDVPSLHKYVEENPNAAVRYYKGLGSNDMEEAKWLAHRFEAHLTSFKTDDVDLGFLGRCFGKDTNYRKELATSPYEEQELGDTESFEQYATHFFKQYIQYDNFRKICSTYDGLNNSKRKLLFYMLMRPADELNKVCNVSAAAASKMHYLHGDKSIQDTLTKLAQDIVGKENLRYCVPKGQYGQRHTDAKNNHGCSGARYISTKLEEWVRMMFPKEDMDLLDYNTMEGDQIEPKQMVGILPMLLINGARALSTGFTQNIPPHDPRDIIAAVKAKIDGKDPFSVFPYYKGFRGNLEFDKGRWHSEGKYEWTTIQDVFGVDHHTLKITELPLFTWTESYKKDVLLKLADSDGCNMREFLEKHTVGTVQFQIDMGSREDWDHEKVMKTFKLRNQYLNKAVETWTVLNKQQVPETLDFDGILDAWYEERRSLYEKRKAKQLAQIQATIDEHEAKKRFIELSTDDEDVARCTIPTLDHRTSTQEKQQRCAEQSIDAKYLELPVKHFSKDKIEALARAIEWKKDDKAALEARTVEAIWLEEIEAFERVLLNDIGWKNEPRNDTESMAKKVRLGKKRKHAEEVCKVCKKVVEQVCDTGECIPCLAAQHSDDVIDLT